MIVALPFCHKDCGQALKLLRWIMELGALKNERLLLIPSRHASRKKILAEIVGTARKCFGGVRVFVPNKELEIGWPGSANFMFRETLLHVESEDGDDMLFLEPDAIPVARDWLHKIRTAWLNRKHGKEFMGAWMSTGMSGVAVYGKEWRRVAPVLARPVNDETTWRHGWDLYGTPEVVPHAEFTDLIQHIFPKPAITSTEILKPNTVIFHQDKEGVLIGMLAEKLKIKTYTDWKDPLMSERYFFSENSNQAIRSHGHIFSFDPTDSLGGVWRGIYAATDESEQLALESLVSKPESGVREIDSEEYEARKKKVAIKSPDSQQSKPQPQPVSIQPKPGVVVENFTPPEPPVPVPGPVVENIETVLKVGDVKPFDAGPPVKKKRR